MFEECVAVTWHFVDVGPVVSDDVLAELHAAMHNASIAIIGTNAGEHFKYMNASSRNSCARFGFVHTVRQ